VFERKKTVTVIGSYDHIPSIFKTKTVATDKHFHFIAENMKGDVLYLSRAAFVTLRKGREVLRNTAIGNLEPAIYQNVEIISNFHYNKTKWRRVYSVVLIVVLLTLLVCTHRQILLE
jgi:hypothetical protein